ncbi:hypothetical protein ACOME3_007441 [Neoechinorhynchus agilis]
MIPDNVRGEKPRFRLLNQLMKFHLDFEYATWQLVNLFAAPNRVFRSFQFRKKTKDYWARDDPAFYVLFAIFVIAVSLLTSLALPVYTIGSAIRLCLFSLLIECFAVSVLIASIYWLLANRYFLKNKRTYGGIEYAYCFDVHANAIFVVRFIIYIIGYPFIYTASEYSSRITILISNFLWLVSFATYVYFLYLGISAVPILKRPRKTAVLIAIAGAGVLWLLLSLTKVYLTLEMVKFYNDNIK